MDFEDFDVVFEDADIGEYEKQAKASYKPDIYGEGFSKEDMKYDWNRLLEPDLDTKAYKDMITYLGTLPFSYQEKLSECISLEKITEEWWNILVKKIPGEVPVPYNETMGYFTINRVSVAARDLLRKVVYVVANKVDEITQEKVKSVLGSNCQTHMVYKSNDEVEYSVKEEEAKVVMVAQSLANQNAIFYGSIKLGKSSTTIHGFREVSRIKPLKPLNYDVSPTDQAAAPNLHTVVGANEKGEGGKRVKIWDAYYDEIVTKEIPVAQENMSNYVLVKRPTLPVFAVDAGKKLLPLGNWVTENFEQNDYNSSLFKKMSWDGAYLAKAHRVMASFLYTYCQNKSLIGGKLDKDVGSWTPGMKDKVFTWNSTSNFKMSPDARYRGHINNTSLTTSQIYENSTIMVDPSVPTLKAYPNVYIAGVPVGHKLAMDAFSVWISKQPVILTILLGPNPFIFAYAYDVARDGSKLEKFTSPAGPASHVVKNIYSIAVRLTMRNMELYVRGKSMIWAYHIIVDVDNSNARQKKLKLAFSPMNIRLLDLRWMAGETVVPKEIDDEFVF